MSGALANFGFAEAIASTIADFIVIQPLRALGTIIPDCTLEERGSDRLVITEHPVEQGASISDHAYKLPAEVNLRYGWSNSSAGYDTWVIEVYNQLLALQASRSTFTILTGKRIYYNMLIASLDVTTDATSEHALMVNVGCKEVIIVTTQGVTIPKVSEQSAPQAQPPSNGGVKSPVPQSSTPNSLLRSGANLFLDT